MPSWGGLRLLYLKVNNVTRQSDGLTVYGGVARTVYVGGERRTVYGVGVLGVRSRVYSVYGVVYGVGVLYTGVA